MRNLFTLLISLSLTGCLGMPETVTPVKEFQLNRYLGKWYEIARLDHSFERGLEQITAEYSLRQDGGGALTECIGRARDDAECENNDSLDR